MPGRARTPHAAAVERVIDAIGGGSRPLVRHRLVVPNPTLSTVLALAWPKRESLGQREPVPDAPDR